MKETIELFIIALFIGFITGFLWAKFDQKSKPYSNSLKTKSAFTIGFMIALVSFVVLNI